MHNMLIYNLLCVVTQNDSMLRKNMYFCILEYNYQIMREIIRLTTISIVVCLMFAACLSSEDRPIMQTERQKEHIIYPSDSELFSVSQTQKVFFSKGNLQYRASTNTWRFAEHQWDYVGATEVYTCEVGGTVAGSSNHLISPTYDGWIDLFGWGTGDCPTALSSEKTQSTFSDWGSNTISNGEGCVWRTLTDSEWDYVLFKRNTASGIRHAHAVVNGINGLIILPDNWKSEYYTLNGANKTEYSQKISCYDNMVSLSDWNNKLEKFGAVFLPTAGQRRRMCIEHNKETGECCQWGACVDFVGYSGSYWTATAIYGSNASSVRIHSFDLMIGDFNSIGDGKSVRLVCDKQ